MSTPGHKYFLPETKEWIAAESLKIGTKVLLSDGSYGIIANVREIHYDEAQTTYNFEVAEVHTYYVGNGVLVHNKGGCGGNEQWVDTYDEAQQIAEQHVGADATFYNGKPNIKVSSDGLKVARFDTDLTTKHVQHNGPHINLETYQQAFGTKGGKPITNIHLRWRN